jgi:hypothetical protein
MARRANYLTRGQYCALIRAQHDAINAAIECRLPVTCLDSIFDCAVTWDSGYSCYTIHHKRKYNF